MFDSLETLPPDPILGLATAFREDLAPSKVDLSVGVYRDRNGITPVMAAVVAAERALIDEQSTKAYLPPAAASASAGKRRFRTGASASRFGVMSAPIQRPSFFSSIRLSSSILRLR